MVVTCCSRSWVSPDCISYWVCYFCSWSGGRLPKARPENWRCPMIDLIEIWYGTLAVMLTVFVVTEGFDIGAGMLQPLVGKTDAERRLVVAAIGPLWSWHEVWLVGFGGTLMATFPNI